MTVPRHALQWVSQVVALCAQDLARRGDAGKEALASLQACARGDAPHTDWDVSIAAILTDAARDNARGADAPPARAFVLGDVHGRWDVIEGALRAHGLIDDAGAWAGQGATLAQMGDLLDADLTAQYPQHADPDGARLVAAYAPLLRAAQAAPTASPEARADIDRCLSPDPLATPEALWTLRHRWVGAALVWRTVRAWMRLEAEAAASGGALITLLGNHEADLLSGRGWWYKAQKQAWLALEGAQGLLPDGPRGPLTPAEVGAHEALRWLAARPVVAVIGGALLMHGGPTAAMSRALARHLKALPRPLGARAEVLRWLSERFEGQPWDAEAYAEGRSLLSPDRLKDDPIGDPAMVTPWLIGTGCGWLLLGHSPFLGLDPGLWVDPQDPSLRAHLGCIQRLGVDGAVLKLDTNLKRADAVELLALAGERVTSPAACVGDAAGRASALWAAQRVVDAVDARRGPALIDLAEPGLDGDAFSALMDARDALEAHLSDADRAALGPAIGTLLRASPSTLTPLLEGWHDAITRGEPRAALAATTARAAALRAAVEGIARRLHAAYDGDGPLRVSLDPRDTLIDGIRYQLLSPTLEAIWRRQRAAGQAPSPAIAALLTLHHDLPAVCVKHFAGGSVHEVSETTHPWTPTSPDATTWDALARFAHTLLLTTTPHPDALQTPPPPLPPHTHTVTTDHVEDLISDTPQTIHDVQPSQRAQIPPKALRALYAHNAAPLGKNIFSIQEDNDTQTEPNEDPTAPPTWRSGWTHLSAPKRTRAVLLPSGDLILADTTFTAPTISQSLYAVSVTDTSAPPKPMAEALLSHWNPPQDALIPLFAYLKPEVVRAINAGQLDWLRALSLDPKAPAWRSGCYLFTTPVQAAAAHFAPLNPIPARFAVPYPTLRRWLAQGWAALNLMISDAAAPLDPSGHWGAPEVVPEVVAAGEDGVRAMWACRVA